MSAERVWGSEGVPHKEGPQSQNISMRKPDPERWLVYLWDSQYASVCHLGDMSGQVRK